jgi:hypothetical protein
VIRRGVVLLVALLLTALAPNARANAAPTVVETTSRLTGSQVRHLPLAADHVALYWVGHPHARVRVAFGDGPLRDAGRDDLGAQRHDGRTYGAMLLADRATSLRVVSNEGIAKLTVLAIADHPLRWIGETVLPKKPAPAKVARPAIIARSDWGADESLRFSNGREKSPPTFHPIQKLIVHHTDTANGDPNPASTVRAIYRYHVVSQGWGDIGYNFLIDEAGHIYKGRNSHASGSDADTITGQDAAGNGVTGAHARGYNAGSVGVALLGTLTNQDATAAAKHALEDLLAWEAQSHGIDPHGSSTYTSPTDGHQKTFPNIAGHHDVGDTQCPGGAFYATLPAVRDAVAARISAAG